MSKKNYTKSINIVYFPIFRKTDIFFMWPRVILKNLVWLIEFRWYYLLENNYNTNAISHLRLNKITLIYLIQSTNIIIPHKYIIYDK